MARTKGIGALEEDIERKATALMQEFSQFTSGRRQRYRKGFVRGVFFSLLTLFVPKIKLPSKCASTFSQETDYLGGQIEEVFVSMKPLSPEEVKDMYNNGEPIP